MRRVLNWRTSCGVRKPSWPFWLAILMLSESRSELEAPVAGTGKKIYDIILPQQSEERRQAWEGAKGMLKDTFAAYYLLDTS